MTKTAMQLHQQNEKFKDLKKITPPREAKLTRAEKKYFSAIVEQRLEWDKAEILKICDLCKLNTQILQCDVEVQSQGMMILSPSGAMVAHPLLKMKTQLISNSNQIMRMLQLFHKDAQALNLSAREAKKSVGKKEDDDDYLLC